MIKNVPPADINGSGNPLTGISPTVIAVLTKTWASNIDPKPIKIKLENLSFERYEFLIILLIRYPKVNSIIIIAIKPNSSPMTDKMKSDSCTGKNFKWVWVPCPQPFPKRPPEPIAVLLWIIW